MKFTAEELKILHRESRRLAAQRMRARKDGNDVPFLKLGPQTIRRGPDHHSWKPSGVSEDAGRGRARKLYPNAEQCAGCGKGPAERHHKDGNTNNNSPENIAILCRRCHMMADNRLARLIDQNKINAKQNSKVTDLQILEIRRRYFAGEEQKTLRTEFGLSSGRISDLIHGKSSHGKRATISMVCFVCGEKGVARGLCNKHYLRQQAEQRRSGSWNPGETIRRRGGELLVGQYGVLPACRCEVKKA